MAEPVAAPTVGRVVHYYAGAYDNGIPHDAGKPLAAIIVYVFDRTCVNLAVFDRNGHAHERTSVPLQECADPASPNAHCAWPPRV